MSLTLSQTTNLDSSKLKGFADDNFKFVESCGKVSERIENIVGKGEIARYEQLLLFPQCFQKTSTANMYKPGLVWERVNWVVMKGTVPTHFFFSNNIFIKCQPHGFKEDNL